jgi:hypothetical protein
VPDHKITQSENIVGRDQAGRDINKSTVFNYRPDPGCRSEIVRLTEKFRAERASDAAFKQAIAKLEHFQTQVPDDPLSDLEQKMEAVGCSAQQLEFAKKTKELFAKKLIEFQLSESAQRIQALLLAEVYSRFHLAIAPMIAAGADLGAINKAVQHEIIDPIQQMLEENVLELYADEINGMLYFSKPRRQDRHKTGPRKFSRQVLFLAGRFERRPKIANEVSILAIARFFVRLAKQRRRMNGCENFRRQLRR